MTVVTSYCVVVMVSVMVCGSGGRVMSCHSAVCGRDSVGVVCGNSVRIWCMVVV